MDEYPGERAAKAGLIIHDDITVNLLEFSICSAVLREKFEL